MIEVIAVKLAILVGSLGVLTAMCWWARAALRRDAEQAAAAAEAFALAHKTTIPPDLFRTIPDLPPLDLEDDAAAPAKAD